MFLFLTGYLLLDRDYDISRINRFWRKNWLALFMTTEIWIVLYDVFLRVFHFQHWSTKGILKDMLFLNQVHIGHMWYMPMIIGLYVCIPFAAFGVVCILRAFLESGIWRESGAGICPRCWVFRWNI